MTISAPLVLGVAQTWTNNSSNLLTISGGSVGNGGNTLTLAGSGNTLISAVISGSGALIDNAAGTVGLTGANTFSGQTQARQRSLVVGQFRCVAKQHLHRRRGQRPGIRAGHRHVHPRRPSGSSGLTLSDIGGGAVTLQVGNNGASTTYSGALSDSGSGGLTKTGSGVLTLTRANSYGGATTILAGTLQVVSGGSFGNTAISVANGATFAPMPGAGAVVAGSSGAGTAGATLNLGPGAHAGHDRRRHRHVQSQSAIGLCGHCPDPRRCNAQARAQASSGTDSILVNIGTAAVSGTNTISIAGLRHQPDARDLSPLISAPSGLSGTLLFPNSSTSEALTVGGTPYNLTLNSSGTAETVHVSAVSAPASYQLATTVANSTIILSGSTTVTSTIQNTGVGPAGLHWALGQPGRQRRPWQFVAIRHGLDAGEQRFGRLHVHRQRAGHGSPYSHRRLGHQRHDWRFRKWRRPDYRNGDGAGPRRRQRDGDSGQRLPGHARRNRPFGGGHGEQRGGNAERSASRFRPERSRSGTLSSGPATPYFVSAGSAQTYTASFNAGNTPGVLSNTVTLASAGDNQSLPGASSPGSLSVSITGNVYSGQAEWNATSGPWGTSANWKDTVGGGPSGAPGVLGYATDTATFGAAVQAARQP